MWTSSRDGEGELSRDHWRTTSTNQLIDKFHVHATTLRCDRRLVPPAATPTAGHTQCTMCATTTATVATPKKETAKAPVTATTMAANNATTTTILTAVATTANNDGNGSVAYEMASKPLRKGERRKGTRHLPPVEVLPWRVGMTLFVLRHTRAPGQAVEVLPSKPNLNLHLRWVACRKVGDPKGFPAIALLPWFAVAH